MSLSGRTRQSDERAPVAEIGGHGPDHHYDAQEGQELAEETHHEDGRGALLDDSKRLLQARSYVTTGETHKKEGLWSEYWDIVSG